METVNTKKKDSLLGGYSFASLVSTMFFSHYYIGRPAEFVWLTPFRALASLRPNILRVFRTLAYRSLITVHRSLITVHRSLLTVYRSLITVHRSLITVHRSLITVYRSLITVHRSLFTVCCLLFTAYCLPLTVVAGTELGATDDLTVLGIDGTVDDPDVEIKGFSIFGSTNVLTHISTAAGNTVFNGAVEVSSDIYIVGKSTFIDNAYFAGAGNIFVNDGSANQMLQKNAAGNLEWIDGSSLGDDLGNHVATTTLDMADFDIVNIGSMTVDNGEGGISIAPYFDPALRYAGDKGISIGSNTYNNYNKGVGVGYNAYGNYSNGVGVGYEANNNNTYGVGVGAYANSNNTYGVGVGFVAYGNYSYGVGVGLDARDNNTYGVGVGAYAQENNDYAVGLGAYSQNNDTYGTGLGAYTTAASSSVALGSYAKANAKESLAIGAGTVNNSTGTASFGVYAIETSSNIVAVGSITANAFFGDGSNLTNVDATDDTKVLKAGDTMTGQLTVSGSTLTIIAPDTVPSSLWVSTSATTPHLYVSTNGNVGIGTDDPGYKLEVKDTGAMSFQVEPLSGYVSLRLNGIEVARMKP